MAAGIVVAAGTGRRLGAEVPKAFVEVAGASLVSHAVAGLRAAVVAPIVVVVPAGWEDRARADVGADVEVVTGGATRTASVGAGLAALSPDPEVVAVHDAARPLVPVSVIADAVAAVHADVVAAAPGLPLSDTIKQVGGEVEGEVDGGRAILGTVDRRRLVAIQTPQVFRRAALVAGHDWARRGDRGATDDLALVEAVVEAGLVSGRIVATAGSVLGMKVTSPADLLLVAAMASARTSLDSGDST